MTLRVRLALTLIAVAIPVVIATEWLRRDQARRIEVATLAEYARDRMESGGREICEANPETFRDPPMPVDPTAARGEDSAQAAADDVASPVYSSPLDPRLLSGPRLELFAYDAKFESKNPAAPDFPAEFARELAGGADEVGDLRDENGVSVGTAGVRMGWRDGESAFVFARRARATSRIPLSQGLFFDAAVAGCLLVAVIVAVGPAVRRMRRLSDDVRLAAADRYREAVRVEGTDEVGELARAFNSAGGELRSHLEALERRERALRDFVENSTHDVMVPLTVLQGHLTRIRDSMERGVAPDRETVRDALEESHYLASLVHNLGAAAKLDDVERALPRDPFSWNRLVERVVLRHAPIAREKKVELDFAVPEREVRALGDLTLVEQALSNVVHNAVRYNHAGGHVAVLLEERDGRFSVRVFDDGPGVAESELARLAERSYRGDEARARHPDGKGLGLAIAKDVADRHGFALELRKPEGGGFEVEFAGPIAPRA